MKNNNNGIGILVILLGILIVAVVSLVGLYVYNNKTKQSSDTSQSNVMQNEEINNNGVITIKELDLTIPLEGWGYEPRANMEGQYLLYSQNAKEITTKISGCSDYAVAWVFKSAENYTETQPGYPALLYQKGNEYYYLAFRSEASCLDFESNAPKDVASLNEQQMNDINALKKAWVMIGGNKSSFIPLTGFENASANLVKFAQAETENTKCLSMQLIKEFNEFAVINQGIGDSDENGKIPLDGSCGGYGSGARYYYKYEGGKYILLFTSQDSLVCGSKEIEELPVEIESTCIAANGDVVQR